MTINKNELSLLLLSQGIKYLSLVENSLVETIKQGNLHLLVADHEVPFDEYDNKTKWSDFNVIVPVLFNLYHGLELIIKGLLVLDGDNVKADHNLENIYYKLTLSSNIPQGIKDILACHFDIEKLNFPNLKYFLSENNISMKQLYQSLRYPVDKSFVKVYEYGSSLHYKEDEAIEYFKQIIKDSKELRKQSVSHYRSCTPLEID